ncbi:MAG TPA: glutathione S-transferase N-terminal domain-containing protein, partial [Steroidobacteraceae bacterium]|nr:glutathione S-transferase N-terminal domain-containing protein [Steroidobacteraceae bacterium]
MDLRSRPQRSADGRHHRRRQDQKHRPEVLASDSEGSRPHIVHQRAQGALACAELDLPFEHVESDPKLLARNPNALVPVIQDGELVLWESSAICRYLAGKQPRATLLPAEPQSRALVEQWMDWQATDLNMAWRYGFLALARHSTAHTDSAAIAHSVAEWNQHMRMLDAHFAHGGQFVTGEFFTLADVVLGLTTHRWLHTPMDRPHLDA